MVSERYCKLTGFFILKKIYLLVFTAFCIEKLASFKRVAVRERECECVCVKNSAYFFYSEQRNILLIGSFLCTVNCTQVYLSYFQCTVSTYSCVLWFLNFVIFQFLHFFNPAKLICCILTTCRNTSLLIPEIYS